MVRRHLAKKVYPSQRIQFPSSASNLRFSSPSLIMHKIQSLNQINVIKTSGSIPAMALPNPGSLRCGHRVRRTSNTRCFKSPLHVPVSHHLLKNQLVRLFPPSVPLRLEMIGREGPPFAPSRLVGAPPPPRSGFAMRAPAFMMLLNPPTPPAPAVAIFRDETLAASSRSLTAASCDSNLQWISLASCPA